MNPRQPRWQRGALPLSYTREKFGEPFLGGRGFEPPRVSPTAPKAVASASSAIRPNRVVGWRDAAARAPSVLTQGLHGRRGLPQRHPTRPRRLPAAPAAQAGACGNPGSASTPLGIRPERGAAESRDSVSPAPGRTSTPCPRAPPTASCGFRRNGTAALTRVVRRSTWARHEECSPAHLTAKRNGYGPRWS